MDQNQEIIDELKSLNKKLERFTHPAKFTLFNFLGGTFHALGTIFGTLIVTSAIIYIFSQFNITKSISQWFENTLNQINWSKIITPEIKQIETIQEKTISPSPIIEQLN
jgi:hypothetical protein